MFHRLIPRLKNPSGPAPLAKSLRDFNLILGNVFFNPFFLIELKISLTLSMSPKVACKLPLNLLTG